MKFFAYADALILRSWACAGQYRSRQLHQYNDLDFEVVRCDQPANKLLLVALIDETDIEFITYR